jgi:hypothetical protein
MAEKNQQHNRILEKRALDSNEMKIKSKQNE